MEISTLFILLLALDSSVHAFGEGPFQGWFQSVPDQIAGPLPVPSDLIVYQDQNPNVSRSATFNPFENTWAELGPDSVLRNAEWTWRVNVSQFYAPYNGSDAVPSDRQAFVSQTYDFSWSTEGNISEALDGATGPLCITQLNAWTDLPVNVTNGLTDGTSCIPALGQACVDAILNKTPRPSIEEGCKWGDYGRFDEMPECRGSFGRDRGLFGTFGAGFSLGDATNQINSGDTFWVNMSGPVLGYETWLYETVANQIQLLLFSALLPTSTQSNTSTVPGMELLCLRANNAKLPDFDINKDGIAVVGEVVLLSAGTSTTAGVDLLTYLGFMALIAGVVIG
ncbi:hypothetical protein GQX73_g8890 [Xylaria multiplex]|uniref:Peptidase A1 domain-containing protein n=1 Tax=Xylaria multiplex TaxID=323545 RepID=A0A7C8MP14_9PEZI|nr:hypothetical protein GQX73_g8890 [Xylaria multiplex]